MSTNYLKIAIRNLLKHKTFSFIHIIGLTISITCIIFIFRFVQFESSYDKFNANADRIIRITGTSYVPVPVPLAPALKEYFSQVSKTVRIINAKKTLLANDDKVFYEENLILSDQTIFDVFSFPFRTGDSKTALTDPYSIVITKDMAYKYFGNDNPLGKKITLDNKFDFQVTGILENIPLNSHLQFGFICPLESAKVLFNSTDFFENRMNTTVATYCLLKNKEDIATISSRLDDFVQNYFGKEFYMRLKKGPLAGALEYRIQPLTSIHLYSDLSQELGPNGSITSVYIFSSIAILILLIACINYMNLAAARYIKRLKEVGIRKVMGAGKFQIIIQFLSESVLLTFIANILAISISEITSPWLSSYIGNKQLFASIDSSWLLWVFVITISAGVLAGIYPAFFVARHTPVNILSKSVLFTKSRISLKSILVTIQFIVCNLLIVITIVISNQLSFIQNRNLGFNKEYVLVIPIRA